MGFRNLDGFWFGWMKVVFDWWIMFGIVWVKKFCDLVEIWGKYECLKVCGNGGFREWFEGWEMFVLKNEGRRREKIRYMACRGRARPCHYRHGPCQGSGFWGFLWAWSGTTVPLQARVVPSFWHWAPNFFSSPFSWILLGQLPTKQLKTTKNKQKAIKCVGCLPRSARLESLAWRLESVLRKDQRDHIV